jgi:hypothetical protein
LPDEAAHIWDWYVQLANQRGSNGLAPEPLRWLDIWAWSKLTGIATLPWEIDAVIKIDAIYRTTRADQKRRADANAPSKPKATRRKG